MSCWFGIGFKTISLIGESKSIIGCTLLYYYLCLTSCKSAELVCILYHDKNSEGVNQQVEMGRSLGPSAISEMEKIKQK